MSKVEIDIGFARRVIYCSSRAAVGSCGSDYFTEICKVNELLNEIVANAEKKCPNVVVGRKDNDDLFVQERDPNIIHLQDRVKKIEDNFNVISSLLFSLQNKDVKL